MNKLKKRLSSLLVFLFCIFSLSAVETKVVETRHFKIIYDERTENAAKEIYSFAENAYTSLVHFFKEDPFLFIPVYIEPEEKVYNAYYTSFPYNRIVIYDAPVHHTLDNTENTLYMTFLHELTHAFTFSIKSGFGDFMTQIFGDWANISVNLHMLLFMQEGISVFTESMDGGGRLNDPFFYTPLIQAKIEGKDISYMDASGGRDIMPGGNMWYVYGGAFNKWMAQRYGERDLASFYTKISKNLLSFPQNGYSSVFSNKLWSDWNRFLDDMETPQEYSYPTIMTEESRSYSDLVIFDSEVYALSSSKEALIKLGGKEERILSFYSALPDLSISREGEFLLPYVNGKESYVSIYNREGERCAKYDGYYDGAFLGTNLVLTSTVDRITYLTIMDEKSQKVMDLGRDVTIHEFTSNDDGVFFLLSRKGEEKIAYLDRDCNLYLLDTDPDIVFSSLSASSSSLISFSYLERNKEGGLPKYGEIESDTMTMYLSPSEYTGGVNYPVRFEDTVYFVSQFFDHSAISREDYEKLEMGEKGKVGLGIYERLEEEYDSVSFDGLSLSYNPLSTMKKGALIPLCLPLSSFYDPSPLLGVTWMTEDATETYSLLLSGGYGIESDSFSFGASISSPFVSFSFSGDVNPAFYNWESDLGLTYSFTLSHIGEEVKVEDVMGWVSLNGRGSFNNYLSLSYENLRQRGVGRHHTYGWGAKLAAFNLQPSLSLFAYIPGIFPYNPISPLDYAIPFVVEGTIDMDKVSLFSRFQLLTYEVQKSLRFLSLYFTHLDLYAKCGFSWFYDGESLSQYSLGLSTTLSPILGQLSRIQVEIGAELNYNEETGMEVKFVLGAH